jgi:hypothetical protein
VQLAPLLLLLLLLLLRLVSASSSPLPLLSDLARLIDQDLTDLLMLDL